MDTKDWVTLITAVWGAITGTVAIILRIHDTSRDNPHLLVQPQFEFSGFDLPHEVALQITVTNTGHRPTTVDAIFAHFRPHRLWERPVWWLRRKGKIWLASSHSKKLPQTIEEAKIASFYFKQDRIWPTPELDPMNLRRIVVRDKAGRKWKSTARFGQERLRSERFADKLETEDLESQPLQRKFSIRLYHMDRRYHLRLRYLLDNTYKYHYENSSSLSEAQEIYSALLRKGREFIAGETNNPVEQEKAA